MSLNFPDTSINNPGTSAPWAQGDTVVIDNITYVFNTDAGPPVTFWWSAATPGGTEGLWQRNGTTLTPFTNNDTVAVTNGGGVQNITLNGNGASDFNGNMVIGAAPGTAGNSGVEFRPSGRFHSRVNDAIGASVGINNGNLAFWIGQNDALAAADRVFEINRFGRSRQDVRAVSAAGAWDLEQGNLWQTDNTAGSDTIQNPGNATAGMSGLIFTRQAITTWGNNFDFPGGTAPASVPANSVVPFYVVADNQILIGNATENVS